MNDGADAGVALDFVVDASVGIKLFVDELLSEKAEALFEGLTTDPPARLYVPDIFYLECTNILWKYVRRFGLEPERARQDLTDLGALELRAVPTTELIPAAFDIAIAHGVTAYDACYVALSMRLDVDLVTADERLARAFAHDPYKVRSLRDLPG